RISGINLWRKSLEKISGENLWRKSLEKISGENLWRKSLEKISGENLLTSGEYLVNVRRKSRERPENVS
ncbi:hypothetical protein Bpfe_013277, partial [Biomphalaria pfeifferi]